MYSDAPTAWSDEENALIRAHLNDHPFPAIMIAQQLQRSPHSVKARVGRFRTEAREGPKTTPKTPVHRLGRRALKTKESAERNCLNCRAPFISWNVKKNRLCPKCCHGTEDVQHTRHAAVKGAQ